MSYLQGYTIGDWVIEPNSIIGRGASADVYKAVHKHTKQVVAVKAVDIARITRGNQKMKENLKSESLIMKDLVHENIVQLIDVFMHTESQMFFIFEYCAGGDFSKYLHKHKQLSETKSLYFMRQLAAGLKYLHSKHILHRDLKPQNLLLTEPSDPTTLKISSFPSLPSIYSHDYIADFGFAKVTEPQSVTETICGSPLYMAPEILRGQKYTIKADLWSVGVILYEMLVGAPPIPATSSIQLVQKLEKTKSVEFPKDISVSAECRDLIESLLQVDPLQRMSWEEFFLHPWLNLFSSLKSVPEMSSSGFRRSLPEDSAPFSHRIRHASLASDLRSGRSISEELPPFPHSRGRSVTEGRGIQIPSRTRYTSSDDLRRASDPSESPQQQLFCFPWKEGEEAVGRAEAIGKVGQRREEGGYLTEALCLYVKATQLIHLFIQQNHSDNPRYVQLFHEYKSRAEVEKNDKVFAAEKLIYDYALHLGREGAVQELLNNLNKSESHYLEGLVLLQQLEVEALVSKDKQILSSFVNSFSTRLAHLKALKSKNMSTIRQSPYS